MPQHLPRALFHATREQRLAHARERFFEEGVPPSGIVHEAVAQSWGRCRRARPDPHEAVAFDLVTRSRAQLALQRNRPLLSAWAQERPQLEAALGGTACAAMLTDATGVLVASACAGRAHEQLMPIATRVGVNLCEEAVGTTAPGVVLKTGQAVCVLGAEHYFDSVGAMQCAAAPIRNLRGELAGVLDISSERLLFDFDAAAVVGLYAAAIENRLLVDEAREHLVLRMQLCAPLLDTPMVALLGVDAAGQVVWTNGAAARLLGGRARAVEPLAVEDVLGIDLRRLSALPDEGAAPVRLASGLTVWARRTLGAPDGLRQVFPAAVPAPQPTPVPARPGSPPMEPSAPAATPAPPSDAAPASGPASLRARSGALVLQTLRECGGNVSEAARRLGVSRGLVYRQLKQAPGCAETGQPQPAGKPDIARPPAAS